MNHEATQTGGWIVDGFQAWLLLWIWCGSVLLYGLYRTVSNADPDTIRPSGPTGQ